jgi:hypothetical protein
VIHMDARFGCNQMQRHRLWKKTEEGRARVQTRCRARPTSATFHHSIPMPPARLSASDPAAADTRLMRLHPLVPPPRQVAAAARAAATCFERFVRSYEVKGKLPEKLPEGHEGVFLSACFNLGRIMHRMQPTAGYVPHTGRLLLAAPPIRHCHVELRRDTRWSPGATKMTHVKLGLKDRESRLSTRLSRVCCHALCWIVCIATCS